MTKAVLFLVQIYATSYRNWKVAYFDWKQTNVYDRIGIEN